MNNREIKRRIASVKETVKITRAMYSISVAKMLKGRAAYPSAESFLVRNQEVMDRLAATSSDYFRERGERTAFLVIGGDKGLCGDYNQRVFECARTAIAERKERFLFTVGTVTRDMLSKAGYEPDMEFLHSAEDPTPESAYSMAADLVNLFDEGLLDRVCMVYSAVEETHSEPKSVTLLPYLQKEVLPAPREEITQGAVKRGVYQYLAAAIYHGLVSSSLAENLARVKAMPQATENGEAMIADLTAKYHKMRQESITRAMQDVGYQDKEYEQGL